MSHDKTAPLPAILLFIRIARATLLTTGELKEEIVKLLVRTKTMRPSKKRELVTISRVDGSVILKATKN